MSDGTLVLSQRSSVPTGISGSTTSVWSDTDGLLTSTDSSGSSYAMPQIADIPASGSSSGVAGQIAFESGFIYICIASDTWEKAVIATW